MRSLSRCTVFGSIVALSAAPAGVCGGAETATDDDDKTAIIAVVLYRCQQRVVSVRL